MNDLARIEGRADSIGIVDGYRHARKRAEQLVLQGQPLIHAAGLEQGKEPGAQLGRKIRQPVAEGKAGRQGGQLG